MNETYQTLSFRRIFINARLLFFYLLRKWILIVTVALLGGIAGICFAYWSKPKYTGQLNFVLSDGNSQGGFSSLVSQFGFDLGSSGDVFSQDNVMTLMTSRRILSRALFRTLPGTKESLVNSYIQTEQMDQKWQKDSHLATSYPFPKDYASITPLQDSLFKEIYARLTTGGSVSVQQPDKKVNIFQVTTTYYDQKFACYLTKYLVEEASSFYIETKTSIARQNLMMLNHEADSLQARLGGNIRDVASAVDQTLNLNQNYQIGRVPVQKSQVDAAVTQAAYTEVVKNLEIAKITLAKAFPIYQIIDEPSLPLKMEKPSRLLTGILSATVAALLIMAFFACKFFLVLTEKHEESISIG